MVSSTTGQSPHEVPRPPRSCSRSEPLQTRRFVARRTVWAASRRSRFDFCKHRSCFPQNVHLDSGPRLGGPVSTVSVHARITALFKHACIARGIAIPAYDSFRAMLCVTQRPAVIFFSPLYIPEAMPSRRPQGRQLFLHLTPQMLAVSVCLHQPPAVRVQLPSPCCHAERVRPAQNLPSHSSHSRLSHKRPTGAHRWRVAWRGVSFANARTPLQT